MSDNAEDTRFMDFLLFRSFKHQTTEPEEETVAQWRRVTRQNEDRYQELSTLLAVTADAYHEKDLPGPPEAAELLGTDHDASFFERLRLRAARRRLIVAGAAVFLAALLFRPPGENPGLSTQEFVTGRNDVATVRLDDGTFIRLGPSSRLVVGSLTGERAVMLDGRAFFAVARVEGVPFTVRTRGGDAVVLGTRFEAETSGEELRLTVVEGRVALTANQNRVELGAGEMGRAFEGALSAPIKVDDMVAALAWMGDLLVFQRTPIAEVATELEDRFGVEVDVQGTGLETQTVTASFVDEDFQDVFRIVCRVLAATCTLEDGRATINLL